MKDVKLITAATGLNTKVDPVRVPYNPEAGVSDLSEAVDVTIDNTGRVQTRSGNSLLISGDFHSVWCDDSDAFLVEETPSWGSIMRISPDFSSLEGIVSGLTKNRRMSFANVNGDIYYSNGFQKGIISEGIARDWETQTYHDEESLRQFVEVPNGTILERHKNRIIIAVGNVIWVSEPDVYGLFDYRSSWAFPSEVIMVASVESGIFVSDRYRVYFLRGNSPHDFIQNTAYYTAAHEHSLCTERLDLFDMQLGDSSEYGAVWSCKDGLLLGMSNGQVNPLTKPKIDYPSSYTRAASLLCGYHVINTLY